MISNAPVSLAIVVLLAVAVPAVFVLVPRLLGARRASSERQTPYECGLLPVQDTKSRFSVKFYLVAVLFILFDLEVAFIFPWAVVYDELAVRGFLEMLVFVGVLFLGLMYVIRKGALDWD